MNSKQKKTIDAAGSIQRPNLSDAKRIVIKIGTNVLMSNDRKLNIKVFESIAEQVSQLKKKGKEIIIITSGAVGLGLNELGLEQRPQSLPTVQLCAAMGQIELMKQYKESFGKRGYKICQILITHEDFSNRITYLNLRNVMNETLSHGVIPIINENDCIVIDEISFGDNDRLSALVTSKLEANLLILASNVDGLYDKNPSNIKAELIKIVSRITPAIKQMCKNEKSKFGKGSMLAKIEAVKIVNDFGIPVIIVNGTKENTLVDCITKEVGTIFLPDNIAIKKNKERWIEFAAKKGDIEVDEGAKDAILKGVSLLPKGIIKIVGKFKVGHPVTISCNEITIAYALVDYDSEDLQKIKGHHSDDIERILGYKTYTTAVKSNNIVLVEK